MCDEHAIAIGLDGAAGGVDVELCVVRGGICAVCCACGVWWCVSCVVRCVVRCLLCCEWWVVGPGTHLRADLGIIQYSRPII